MGEMVNQCNAIAKTTGKRCQRGAIDDTPFCAQHKGWSMERVKAVTGRMGGPSFGLDERLIEQFDNVLRAGNYVQTAIAYLGVSESSFYRWLKRGEELVETGAQTYEEALCLKLWETVTRARAAAEIGAVGRMAKIARGQGLDDKEQIDARVRLQADQWFLERSFRKRWGRRTLEVEHSGSVELELNLPKPKVLTAEVIEDVEYEEIEDDDE